jgi:hypothetical protein
MSGACKVVSSVARAVVVMASVFVCGHQHGQISSFDSCEELLGTIGPDWDKLVQGVKV